MEQAISRDQWSSRLTFVLAAAGSAVGLGNIWKFPYITGMNGGGVFVLIYLGAILFVSMPILAAEVLIGRAGQASPVGAIRRLSRPGSPWIGVGLLGVVGGLIILSYYSVVAGWCLDYIALALTGKLSTTPVDGIPSLFDELYVSESRNLLWHFVFMAMTIGIVVGGVRGGVERASRILMPALFVMMLVLFAYATTLPGFGEAARFVFSPSVDNLTSGGILEALGHSFFSLSVGMGAMLTYGSYLSRRDCLIQSTVSIGVLDTVVSLLACLILFPITFSFGMQPSGGPGLVFKNIPVAFAQLPWGGLWAFVFFALLFVAALTSAISLLETVTAHAIDEWKLSRKTATLGTGLLVLVLGIPSALSGGAGFFGKGMSEATGRSFFDWFDHIASNWLLPMGGLGIATFVAWRLSEELRHEAFTTGSGLKRTASIYRGWLILVRYVAPVGIVAIFLHAVGVI